MPDRTPTAKVDRAMARFARAYADQTERDHQALVTAVARGVHDGTGFRPTDDDHLGLPWDT